MPRMLRETKRSFARCSRGGKMGEGIEGLNMVLVRSLRLVLVFFWMMDRVSLRKMRVLGL
jgi:hypothetical protein